MSALQEILQAIDNRVPTARAQIEKHALDQTKALRWVPNPGPQTAAYYSQADELFFGGQAGGGKSDLMLGIALNCHSNALILREFKNDALALGNRLVQIVGSSEGWREHPPQFRIGTQIIEFDGLPNEKDKENHKGRPRDFYGFDEIGDFHESQYVFITAWNRSTVPDQRCRIVVAGNPPTRSKGLWVIQRWGAWLDPKHPHPAKDGELRWYLRDEQDQDLEVEGPGPYVVDGKQTFAKSRTFIRSKLSDNYELERTGYDSTLARLPKELRDAYREGKFDASLKDHPFQVIPTNWIVEAQKRWKPTPPGVPMSAMGVDVAQGGADNNVLACRYDAWYDKLIVVPGAQTPLGSDTAGLIVAKRRHNADIVLDMGGGYGGGCFQTLRENDIDVIAYKGAAKSMKRTRDRKLGFTNKRSESYWMFREALDPDQTGGSPVCLPPDQELLAELSTPTYEVSARGIQILEKTEVCKLLGRSPDKADAVVMAWVSQNRSPIGETDHSAEQRFKRSTPIKVDMGARYQNFRSRR